MSLRKTRFLLIGSTVIVLVFWLGWIMGKRHYEKEVIDALESRNTKAAAAVLDAWQKSGCDLREQPVAYLSLAMSHAKRGNMEAVLHNLDMLLSFMGK